MKLVIITGMSGAGKTQAARVMEDLGYYVVDNMPPELLEKFIEILVNAEDNKFNFVALVMDVRSGQLFRGLKESMEQLKDKHLDAELLFLDASDEELVTRFKESRRTHPLSTKERLLNGIQRERVILKPLREQADFVVDTSGMSNRQFQSIMKRRYVGQDTEEKIHINVMSFGFKYGVPVDADIILDVRFIENPFYIDSLRPLSGLDQPVFDFVIGNHVTQEFLKRTMDLLIYTIPHYAMEGKKQLIIGIGCTGGRHRSVAITEEISRQLRQEGYGLSTYHRDRAETNTGKHKI